jgi:prophage regulatory protein
MCTGFLCRIGCGGRAIAVLGVDSSMIQPLAPANDNVQSNNLLRFCKLNETRGITYTHSHLYTLESESKFAKRVPLGENRVGWLESEIDEWILGRAASQFCFSRESGEALSA